MRIKRLLSRPELVGNERLSLYASTITYQWVLFATIFWRSIARGLSPAELGLIVTLPGRTVFAAIALSLLLCANQWAGLRTMARTPPEKRGFMGRFTQIIMPRNGAEASLFTALACTAGISEEFIFRGFAFATLARVVGDAPFSVAIAVISSSILFSVAHLYQGRRGIITTFIVGIIFCSVRVWTGNLVAPIIAHMGIDLFVGLYARRVLLSAREISPGCENARGGD